MRRSSIGCGLLLLLLTLTAGCSHKQPPTKTPSAASTKDTPAVAVAADAGGDEWTADERPKFDLRPRSADDTVPRVIRRIVKEQKEEVSHLLELAQDLPDSKGRSRATTEASALSQELAQITAPMDRADSTGLDQVITKLVLLDTRIGILHDALRNATSRGTATVME